MKKFFNYLTNKFKDKVFYKTYALILLPVFVILIFMIFSTYSYSSNYTSLLKNSYLTRLESICAENETSLQNIATMIRILSENDNFMEFATSTEEIVNPEYNISDVLTQVMENNSLIDSITIYNRSTNTVYHNAGTEHAVSYFVNEYHYAEYAKNYWDNYISDDTERKILAPSLVSTPLGELTVIPIVFTKLGDVPIENLIIVNVNLTKILSNIDKLTQNSSFFVLNKQNRNIFNENNDFRSKLGNNFFDEISSSSISGFDCMIDNKKTLVLSYSPGSSILGYSYVATVPYTDIDSSISNISYLIIITGLLVMIAVLFVAYFSTKRIYSPIESLASLFENQSDPESENERNATNTIQRLHTSIQETLEYNSSLSSEFSKALPLIQERYLINLLNSNEHYTPESYSENMPVNFQYEYFCSIVIRLKPTDQFYNLYNNLEYNAIKSGIHNIIQSAFSEKYEAYIIPSEADTLYVLLNLPDSEQIDSIVEILEEFQSVMDFDKEYMTLKIGIGGIYPDLDGLKKSHHEAVNSVSAVIGLTHVKVHSEDSPEKISTYVFGMNEENALLNHLIIGRTDESKTLIENVLSENVKNNSSDTAIMQLYVQILNVIFKVMRMKNIAYDAENSGDFHIITEIIKQPVSVVHDITMNYIDTISNHMGTSATKVDIQAVVKYMEENYRLDLGLEGIADNFNTTPKYLSKLIKDKLGVNFVDYIAGLRINAAKILLTETNKTISDIFMEVGFNNRNTFIRSFKKNTGLTPSEFRKAEKL